MIPLPQGECHLCRLVRNKLPLLQMEDDIWSSSMPPRLVLHGSKLDRI